MNDQIFAISEEEMCGFNSFYCPIDIDKICDKLNFLAKIFDKFHIALRQQQINNVVQCIHIWFGDLVSGKAMLYAKVLQFELEKELDIELCALHSLDVKITDM